MKDCNILDSIIKSHKTTRHVKREKNKISTQTRFREGLQCGLLGLFIGGSKSKMFWPEMDAMY